MKTIPSLLLFTAHVSVLSSVGCASRSVAPSTIGGSDCTGTLLIATMATDFKNAVVSEVKREVSRDRICIRIIDIADLESTAAQPFAAIVVINDYQFGKMDSDARHFLERLDAQDKKKVVLLTTAGSPNGVQKIPEVDAISAASEPAEAGAVARGIVDKLRPRLSSK